ncbi:hypothetical protein NQ317_015233 [Molorchus minor]|uniref:Uncharacterized protein n=1 Tax=Molorchus minor TaxID=1323400 RepID=A0ABQ9JKX8_9CUCU|nr:hypothetical protein NQ317_015233 [Molorchus minor]
MENGLPPLMTRCGRTVKKPDRNPHKERKYGNSICAACRILVLVVFLRGLRSVRSCRVPGHYNLAIYFTIRYASMHNNDDDKRWIKTQIENINIRSWKLIDPHKAYCHWSRDTAVVTAPKSRSSAGWFSLQFDIEETASKLVKVVLKKTCLSGVKNCGISCGSGTDIVLKHNC